jgi:hypothetical protein
MGEQRSSIEIAIYPHAAQKIPIIFRRVPHFFWLQPQLRRYLQSVLKGLDNFVTRGEVVRRNQFGAHRWFSPPVVAGGNDRS